MEKVIWALRYVLLLVRKTLLIPALVGFQLLVFLILPQGKEVLTAISSEEGLVFQYFIFQLSLLIGGFLLFAGAHWLLFFSGTEGTVFKDSDQYSSSRLKIKAWQYHEFIQKYRGYMIRLYTGLLLFSPFFIQVLAYSFVSFYSIRWFLGIVIVLIFNIVILFLRSNRNSFLVESARVFFTGLGNWLEGLVSRLKDFILAIILPKNLTISQDKSDITEYPFNIEFQSKSLLQAPPHFRGFFYSQLALGTLTFILLLSFNNFALESIGPAALMQLGICFWMILLIWVAYLNKVFLFPFYLFLAILLIANSLSNSDHPILYNKKPNPYLDIKPVSIEQAFENWMSTRTGFTANPDGSFHIDNIRYSKENPFRFLIVNAEGGGSRSGYWSALVLDSLRTRLGSEFDKRIFAFSSVSGGSMGVLAYSTARLTSLDPTVRRPLAAFFKEDILAALTNSLIAGEVVAKLIPIYFPKFDRAVAFEKSLDEKLLRHFSETSAPDFTFGMFNNLKTKTAYNPLLLLHATEVETGRRAILSNKKFNNQAFNNIVQLNEKLQADVSMGTAIHLGSRFPVFSPSAAVSSSDGITRHYVDGGYYENGGYETTLELVMAIEKSKFQGLVQPIVISISNSFEAEENNLTELFTYPKGARFFNEIQYAFVTISKVKDANLISHKSWLNQYLQQTYSSQDSIINLALLANSYQIPMNWYLSLSARKNIETRLLRVFKEYRKELNVIKMFPNKPGIQVKKYEDTSTKKVVQPIANIGPISNITELENKPVPEKVFEVSPSKTPELYYYSKSRKQWRLKSEADFNIGKLKPLRKKGRKKKS